MILWFDPNAFEIMIFGWVNILCCDCRVKNLVLKLLWFWRIDLNWLWNQNDMVALFLFIFVVWFHTKRSVEQLHLLVWRYLKEFQLHMIRSRGWSSLMLSSLFLLHFFSSYLGSLTLYLWRHHNQSTLRVLQGLEASSWSQILSFRPSIFWSWVEPLRHHQGLCCCLLVSIAPCISW